MKKTLLLSIISIGFSVLHAQPYNISTFAGNGTNAFAGDGGQATAAELYYPSGVALDALGNIYIGDENNQRIRVVNTSGVISTIAGNGFSGFFGDGGQATAAELKQPAGIVIDRNGNVYISDYDNQRIRMVNTSGIISTFAGNGTSGFSGDGSAATAAELSGPFGVGIDKAGNIYIADLSNNRVRMVNTSGVISTFAGNGTGSYSGDGGAATAAELSGPEEVTSDGSGNIYIADYGNSRIRMVNTSGVITTIAGNGTASFSGDGGAATAAEIDGPTGVSVDGFSDVFISDYSNQRIRMVSAGIISTIAGNGTAGYSGDGGAATAAEINYPYDITVDPLGNVYFADIFNGAIRKLTNLTTSVNNLSETTSVNVYPNPNNGVFTVEVKNENVTLKNAIEVYNVLGEKVYVSSLSSGTTVLNLSNNAKGVYIYRITSSDGQSLSEGKLLIQ